MSDEAREVLPSVSQPGKTWFTPLMVAILLLVLAIVGWIMDKPYFDWLILAIVTAFGVLVTYLVVFSTLPCTEWNWLIIPFNILPAIAWRWRQYWALPMAGILVVWCIGMIVPQHQLVDTALLIVAIAWIATLVGQQQWKLT